MAYSGKFTSFEHPSKYVGNIEKVTYRSMWEKNVMVWLDQNPNVKEWASEEIFFRYEHPITGKSARYFPDFYVKMVDGLTRVIEVKPKKETVKPDEPKRKTKKYMSEVATYLVNQEKWREAKYHCDKANMIFEVWTEDTLSEIGIMKSTKLPKMLTEKKVKHKKVGGSRPKRPRPKRKS